MAIKNPLPHLLKSVVNVPSIFFIFKNLITEKKRKKKLKKIHQIVIEHQRFLNFCLINFLCR